MDAYIVSAGSVVGLLTTLAYAARLRAANKKRRQHTSRNSGGFRRFVPYLPGVAYRRPLGFDGTFKFLDGEVESSLGYGRAELLTGDAPSFADLLHPADKNMVESEMARAIEAREPFNVVYRIRTKDGPWRWLSDCGAAVFADDGRAIELEGYICDISDRKLSEEERVQLHERYRLHAQHGNDLICVHDRDGSFIYVSPSVKRILGYDPGELVDRSLYVLVDPKHRERLTSKIERHVGEEGSDVKCRLRMRKKNGSYAWLEMTCSPNLDSDGYFGRFVTSSRDVTRLYKTKRALQEANRRSWMDTTAIQNMSHELRTPLTGILGFADLLSDDLKEEQRRFAGLIRESGERLMSSVNTLMEYSSLNAGTVRLDRKKVDVREAVGSQVHRYRDAAAAQKIVLQTVTDGDSIAAEADEKAVASITSHLIDNAVKFSDSGDVVTVGVHEAGDDVLLRVADNGIGISEEFMPRLFEPFQQESDGLAREYEGIGLGLSIAKHFVDLHDGRIEVDSEKGRGSVFSVFLPKYERKDRRRDASRRNPQKEEDRSQITATPRHQVLAIDDNDPMRRIITRHLEKQFQVTTAEDPDEALRLARITDFDLVLIDINLGTKKNGVDVLNELRDLPGYVHVPMIAITAYALPEERLKFMRAGFDGYVSKPFTREQLLEEIGRLRKKIERLRTKRAAA